MNREEMQTELDALKRRIAEIEAQMAEPDWVPFPGEIVEGRDRDGDEWVVSRFVERVPERCHQWDCGVDMWIHVRPLQDPNVIQLRPHTPGDPMPCDGKSMVVVRIPDGRISSGKAYSWAWDGIVAWAPLP